jgi:hypothetical protein
MGEQEVVRRRLVYPVDQALYKVWSLSGKHHSLHGTIYLNERTRHEVFDIYHPNSSISTGLTFPLERLITRWGTFDVETGEDIPDDGVIVIVGDKADRPVRPEDI